MLFGAILVANFGAKICKVELNTELLKVMIFNNCKNLLHATQTMVFTCDECITLILSHFVIPFAQFPDIQQWNIHSSIKFPSLHTFANSIACQRFKKGERSLFWCYFSNVKMIGSYLNVFNDFHRTRRDWCRLGLWSAKRVPFFYCPSLTVIMQSGPLMSSLSCAYGKVRAAYANIMFAKWIFTVYSCWQCAVNGGPEWILALACAR